MHQLHGVAGGERGLAEPGPADDAAIVLDHDRAGIEPEPAEQVVQGAGPGTVRGSPLTVIERSGMEER